MELEGLNIVCLDVETARSADDCRYCGTTRGSHLPSYELCPTKPDVVHDGDRAQTFEAIGWHNKAALGLSIGCYYAYRNSRLHFFDRHTLEETISSFVDVGCLLVSFNGVSFDFSLMRGLLRQEADALRLSESDADLFRSGVLVELCDRFKALCEVSYDVLAEIWRVDPQGKFERGLNSLDAIAQANGLGVKTMTGAQAPRLWAEGRYAEVINYCSSDVLKTKALFEMVCHGQPILRGNGQPLVLPAPPGLETLQPL